MQSFCGKSYKEVCFSNSKFFFVFRVEESELDDLSCTDIEQQWGSLKSATLKEYKAKRLSELCHIKSQKDAYMSTLPEVTKEIEQKWRDRLTNCERTA